MTGIDLYREIDEWYDETRSKLNQLLKQESRPFHSPEDIQTALRIMVYAMECEGMLVQLDRAVGDLWLSSIEDIELKLRGIRDTVGRLVGDSIVNGLRERSYVPEDYGIHVTHRDSGFSLSIPYALISMSDLFLVRSKRLSGLSQLYTIRDAWVALMRGVADKLSRQDRGRILHAKVEVKIKVTHKRPLDPDHFWLRPILDGLCQSGILVDDDAKNIVFILSYETATDSNSVEIHVDEMDVVL